MDVGVRELKQRLSSYLERVARGETIRVTDRGVPRALLSPIPGAARLDEGVAQGWVTAPKRDAPPAKVKRASTNLRIEDVLAEDRGE